MPPRATPPRRVVRRASSLAAPVRDVVVGIDPSLTGYGIVLFYPADGSHSELLIKTPPDQTYAQRLVHIKECIRGVLLAERDNIRLICMERPAYDASGAFTGGLVHAATAFALVEVFGLHAVHSAPALVAGNTLKKYVTGKGVGKKGLMVKWVYKKWGFDTDDDNLADAFGLARLASAVLSGEWQHEYEKQCIEVVRKSAGGAMKFAPLKTSAITSGRPTGSTTTAARVRTRSTQSGGSGRETGNARV